MEAEFRERRRKNQEGLEQALRKRLNLMERQDQHGQIRSKQLFAEATVSTFDCTTKVSGLVIDERV